MHLIYVAIHNYVTYGIYDLLSESIKGITIIVLCVHVAIAKPLHNAFFIRMRRIVVVM